MSATLEDYSKKELSRIEHERQEAIKAKGGLPFLPKLELGVTRLKILPVVPKDWNGQNGPRKQFNVTQNGTEYTWSVNPRSPLYRDLLNILPMAPVEIDVVRTGETRSDTRYSVRIAKV